MLGSSVEWYDFLIYGTAAALVFGPAFFPSASPVAGVLASFATFAVGFVARPIGGAVFGHIGDKVGRKRALTAALLLMAASTTLIGLLPTYAAVGPLAPVLLVVLRLVQGVAVGGQWGGSMLLATEHAPRHRRALYGSIPQLGVPVGLVAGSVVYLVLTRVIAADSFSVWGWRLPFLFSVVLFGVAYYIHHHVADSPELGADAERSARTEKSPVLQVIKERPGAIVLAGVAYAAVQAAFYIAVTGIVDYGTRVVGMSKNEMLGAVLISMVGFAGALMLGAFLSDLIDRRIVFAIGVAWTGAWAFALFPLVNGGGFRRVVLALFVAQLGGGFATGSLPGLAAAMFPARLRYSGASLVYQLGAIVGGGLAPFVMVALLDATGSSVFVSVYLASTSLVALVLIPFVRVAEEPAVPVADPDEATCATEINNA
ncbi:MFS transporter [Pseudonocardia ailaonensis]|uniref:MFS transporter n=1 Tax=Pseudonocardia ailaonensis TaxID=367279 RepID=A0ABN2MV38_9PSEU